MTPKRYNTYLDYRDSKLSWLQYIPQHWKLLKVKRIFRRIQRPVRTQDGVVTAFRDGEVTLRSNRRVDGFTNALKEIGYQGVRKGDLLVHAMDGFAGAIGVSNSDGKCSPVCSVCVPQDSTRIDMRYYGYLVRQLAVTDFITSLAKGIRERSTEFRFSEFSTLTLVVPPKEEQTLIAKFLDYETARIDTLIEKQQQLIALLQERRQAVISHAVTKGLNPDVPMRDSGVKWLGGVPAHWKVVAIKHLVQSPIIDGPHETPTRRDDGVPFISAEAISQGFIDFSKAWGYISLGDHARYSKRYKPQIGDIFLVKLGATAGTPAIVETDMDFNIWVPLAAIRLRAEVEPRFVFYVLRSENLKNAYQVSWTYGTQQTLGLRTISNLRIPFPPARERRKISRYLDRTLPLFESLAAKAERKIGYLQERRATLISAAVTGKIDVRGWTPPRSETGEEDS